MNAIFSRSALEFWGFNPGPDIHSMHIDNGVRTVVTWADVMHRRRERQREQVRRKRYCAARSAWRLSVAYFDRDLMGGWHAFLDRREERLWINRDRRWLVPALLRAFPLLLPLGSEHEQFNAWMPAFANQYSRRLQCGEPVGVVNVWWDGNSDSLAVPA